MWWGWGGAVGGSECVRVSVRACVCVCPIEPCQLIYDPKTNQL